jgi:thiol:disulfide interchange protein DsbD
MNTKALLFKMIFSPKHGFQALVIFAFCISLGLSFNAYSAPTQNAQTQPPSALSFLTGDNKANDSNAFLPPDVAFKLSLNAINANTLEAQFTVAPGHYLYRERIQFLVNADANKALTPTIASIHLPKGELKNDANFGEQAVFHHDFSGQITLNKPSSTVSITAIYQGCSEKGLCYAPIKKIFNVNLQVSRQKSDPANPTISFDENDDQSASLLKTGNIWLVVAGFFGAGLLLSLTPCVLPMIPILSSIIVGSQKNLSKRYSFGLSVAYVLGMALSYTLAGIAAGLSGNLLSQSLQSPWVLGASGLVFVLLALSMFGFYELKLPQRFEANMLSATNRFKGGEMVGVFVMGALSALIVSPCVAAPLAGALIYISQTQNVVLGGVALFALSIGMGVPLLLIGASAGQLIPKAGAWMNGVRNFFGVLMLSMAIWLISPVIPLGVTFILWASLLIVTAIFLNALDPIPHHNSPSQHRFAKFCKGLGIVLLAFGLALVIGGLSGAKSLLHPLDGIMASNKGSVVTSRLTFTRVSTLEALNAKLANAQGQAVMLDFYADWCVACKELEAYTFSDPKVQAKLSNTLLLQVDVTANNANDQALLKRFNLFGPPGIVFFDQQGQEITAIKTIGYQDAATFLKTLARRDAIMTQPHE